MKGRAVETLSQDLLQSIVQDSEHASELADALFPGLDCAGRRAELRSGARRLVLFGAGSLGFYLYYVFHQRRIEPAVYCDNNPEAVGKDVHGIRVISHAELQQDWKDALVVVSSQSYREEIRDQLLASGFSTDQVFISAMDAPMVYELISQYWSGFLNLEPDWIKARDGQIREVHDLLEDEPSRELFRIRMALCNACLSPSLLARLSALTSPGGDQYFDEGAVPG